MRPSTEPRGCDEHEPGSPAHRPVSAATGAHPGGPAPDAANPPEGSAHPFELTASGAVVWVRGLGAEGGPAFSLGYLTPTAIDARLTLVGPLFGASVDGAVGSATVREIRITASAGYRIDCVPDRISIEPYLGAGGHNVYARGSADPPYEGDSASAWAFALDAGLRALFRLDPRVGVELGVHGTLTTPPLELLIAGESLTLIDLPALYGTAGLLLSP